ICQKIAARVPIVIADVGNVFGLFERAKAFTHLSWKRSLSCVKSSSASRSVGRSISVALDSVESRSTNLVFVSDETCSKVRLTPSFPPSYFFEYSLS
ncbi:MAG: hypothetical protein RIT18_786, partial [Actinomycetota bacterium]